MNEELKNKLILALKAKGINEGVADLINIADESEIEGVVSKLIQKPLEQTKEQKLADKEVQSEIDRRVTMAIEKIKGTPPGAPTPEKTDDTPEWAKALIEKVNAIESGKVTESKQQQALSLLQKSEVLNDTVKAKWANRIDINSDVPFEEQLKGLEAEFTELRQTLVDSTALAGSTPTALSAGKPSDAELDSILEKI